MRNPAQRSMRLYCTITLSQELEIATEMYGRAFSTTMTSTDALELLAGPVREAITLRDILLAAVRQEQAASIIKR